MDIDTLEAGEELDWLVLHHVFDWKRGIRAFDEAPYRCGTQEYAALWPVSAEIAFAWRVLAHALRAGLTVSVSGNPSGREGSWRATLAHAQGGEAEACGETAPLAICRAALRAVEAALLVKSARPRVPGASPGSETWR